MSPERHAELLKAGKELVCGRMRHTRRETMNGDRAVAYQQGQHAAIREMFIDQMALILDLKDRLRAAERRQEVLAGQLCVLQAPSGAPRRSAMKR